MEQVNTYSKTLLDARNAVYGIINEPDAKQFKSGKVDTYINQCCRLIYGKTNHSLTRSYRDLTPGTPEYLIPDAFDTGLGANIRRVFIESNEISRGEFIPVQDLEVTGEPSSWSTLDDILQLDPVPDSNYQITIMYERDYYPAKYDSDTFMVSDEAVDCATLFAAYMLKLMDEEYTSAGMLRNAYEDALARVLSIPTGIYSAATQYNEGRS